MASYRYLVVGGGMTGDAACKGIRSIDPDGAIALVGEEPDPPYARPPLACPPYVLPPLTCPPWTLAPPAYPPPPLRASAESLTPTKNATSSAMSAARIALGYTRGGARG